MTATDYQTGHHNHDHGPAPELGSAGAGPRPRRPSGTQQPEYRRSMFGRPEIREFVADTCQAQIDELRGGEKITLSDKLAIDQLGKVIAELQGVE